MSSRRKRKAYKSWRRIVSYNSALFIIHGPGQTQ